MGIKRIIRSIKGLSRRREARRGEICIARCKRADAPRKERHSFINLLDISPDGVLIVMTGEKIPATTKLDLQFQLPGAKRPISAQGEVRWAEEVPTREGGHKIFKTGVNFLDLKKEDLEVIKGFMAGTSKAKKP